MRNRAAAKLANMTKPAIIMTGTPTSATKPVKSSRILAVRLNLAGAFLGACGRVQARVPKRPNHVVNPLSAPVTRPSARDTADVTLAVLNKFKILWRFVSP